MEGSCKRKKIIHKLTFTGSDNQRKFRNPRRHFGRIERRHNAFRQTRRATSILGLDKQQLIERPRLKTPPPDRPRRKAII